MLPTPSRLPHPGHRSGAGLVVATIVVLITLLGSTAQAHSGKQSYLYISLYDDAMEGRVELPARDIEPILGFAVVEERDPARATVEANYDDLVAYVADHLRIGDGVENWDVRYQGFNLLETGKGLYVQIPFLVERDFGGAPPRTFVVEYAAIIEGNPEKDALLLIEHDWSSATFENEANQLLGFSVGRTEQNVVLEEVGILDSLGAVLELGTIAIRNHVEHLLLVAAVVLPAGLVAAGHRWSEGAPSTRDAILRASRLVGVLVIAHLSTMWLVGLGAIDLPYRFVAGGVALALIAASGWAVLGAVRPSMVRAEIAVVAAIGVVQGLGVGELFVDDRLDRSRAVLSLVSYSLAVEVGFALTAVLTLVALLLMGRTPLAPATLFVGAALPAAYAIAWIGERLTDGDWPIERVSTQLGWWPRNLFLMLFVVAIGAGLFAWSSLTGRLRPVVADDASSVRDLAPTASR